MRTEAEIRHAMDLLDKIEKATGGGDYHLDARSGAGVAWAAWEETKKQLAARRQRSPQEKSRWVTRGAPDNTHYAVWVGSKFWSSPSRTHSYSHCIGLRGGLS